MGYPPSGRMTEPVRRRLGDTSRYTVTRPPLRHVPGRIPPRFIPPRRFFLQEPRSPEVSVWVPLHRAQHPWNPHGATRAEMTQSVLYRILHLSANRRSCSSSPCSSCLSVSGHDLGFTSCLALRLGFSFVSIEKVISSEMIFFVGRCV